MSTKRLIKSISEADVNHLAQIQAIIWDLDGVHYDFAVATQAGASFYDMCVEAISLTAVKTLGKNSLSYDNAESLAKESLQKYNDQVTAFIPLVDELQFDPREFQTKMLHGFCDVLYDLVQKNCPELFKPDPDTTAHFTKTMGHIKHGILSHACSQRWAIPALQLMHRLDFFHPDHILGFEDFHFNSKGLTAKAITQALELINTSANKAIFVEDTPRNLTIAKQEHPELITILICKQPPEEPTEGIDLYAPSTLEVLKAVNTAKHQYGDNLQMFRGPSNRAILRASCG